MSFQVEVLPGGGSPHRLALRLADADSSDFFDIEVAGKKNWTSLESNVDGEW
jgi:hypothetical protein